MKLDEKLQAVYDYWKPNRYSLKPYLIRDGEKHPFAVICPGGGYNMVCSFVEGKPFAEALNKCGYHATEWVELSGHGWLKTIILPAPTTDDARLKPYGRY